MSAATIAIGVDTDSNVPTAVGVSLILHMLAVLFFVYRPQSLDSVSINTQEMEIELKEEIEKRQIAPVKKKSEARRERALQSFMKIPLLKTPSALRKLEVKAIETRKIRSFEPKLDLQRDKFKNRPDMKLVMERKEFQVAKLPGAIALRDRKFSAEVPKISLVGTTRVSRQVLEKIELAEKRENAVASRIGKIDLGGRWRTFDAAAKIDAKTRTESRFFKSVETERAPVALQPNVRRGPEFKKPVLTAAPALPTRRKASVVGEPEEKKKAVQIEGPLSSRKVDNYSVPPFPQKLEEYGVYEAEVALKFYVSPLGNVIADRITVDKSSSYGWLDRLAMEHLKKWRFESLPMGGSNEWGVITFRFFLE